MSDLKVVDRRWWARGDAPADAAGDADPSQKPTFVEQLEAQVAAKDAELQRLIAANRETAGEFEQARIRLRKEIAKDLERGRRDMLSAFLDVLDNLDRAIGAAPDASADPILKGVTLVRQQFLTTLEGFGVRRVDPMGEPFDPSRHEAVSTMPAATPGDAGRVVGVIRSGYLIGDDVLRPALVAVAAAS